MRHLLRPTMMVALIGLVGCSAGSISGQMGDGRKISGYEPAGSIDGSFSMFDTTEPDEFDLFFAPWITGNSDLKVDFDMLGMMIPLSYSAMTEGAVLDEHSYSTPWEEGAGISPSSCEIEVVKTEIIDRDGIEYFRARLRWDVEYGVDDDSGIYIHFTATDWVESMIY